ncbi:ATP-binding protein [Georgenia sp. 311]|uniref:ATP-binding protein n=1 Tax=Georgenia sp. 311 TaxID=2585134 RepID=UPI0011125685|nr:ATP-binding protein [Georgenia sp. 311]TNC16605.1 ATP-binding protein [Georgenia sp. 311]
MISRVRTVLTRRLLALVEAAEPGHCLRIDDISVQDARECATDLNELIDPESVRVAVLAPTDHGVEVSVETAVGIRNDKTHVFALFVPPLQAHAASSLDNSFERHPMVEELSSVLNEIRDEVESRWPTLPTRTALKSASVSFEGKLDFLSAVLEADDEFSFGRELWRLGLLVDDATGPQLRANLDFNARLVRAVSEPSQATATVRERLQKAGVAPGPVLQKVATALNPAHSDLHDTVGWTRRLWAEEEIDLASIPRDHPAESALETLEAVSFRKANGSPETFSKLELTDDGVLYCQTSQDNPAAVGVKWKTTPGKPKDVARWRLELLPPEDLRSEDTPAPIEMRVAASRNSAQLKLDLGDDDLSGGALFVVRITALDANDTPLLLHDGSRAESETDAFEVVIQEAPVERSTRRSSAHSLAEARLHAVLAGASDTAVDMQAWDLGGHVFGVRVGKHLASQVRIAPTIVALQRRLTADPTLTSFSMVSHYGEPIDPAEAPEQRSPLPAALARKRKDLLTLLADSAPHDVPEVLVWEEEARRLAVEYAQSYRRALDAADDEARRALLALDTINVSVGTASGVEHAVVVLPVHPLRMGWIAAHSQVIDTWCDDLLSLQGAKARRLVVDADLLTRVQPTNMPFTATDLEGRLFVYFDELSYGSALLLEPRLHQPEVVAAAVHGALNLPRESTDMTSAATMVSARIRDFLRSHPEVSSLHVSALNPGDGEILGRAIEEIVQLPVNGEGSEHDGPARMEVIAYGRNAGFASPLPRLTDLQNELQTVQISTRQSHLAPPLGVATRAPAALTAEARATHLALLQDLAVQSITVGDHPPTKRLTAFHDLLTPVITTRSSDGGRPLWVTSPALTSATDGPARAVVEAHRAHQLAVGATLGANQSPSLVIAVEAESLRAMGIVHQLADWVLTLDRHVGLDLYDNPTEGGLGSSSYVLDYAPDFIEGLSHRLTVTTAHRTEVTHILSRAMEELGLIAVHESVTPVIENLLAISGRLVLRLQGSESFAREAVSLAALIAHLKQRDQLDNTIIVPVDSHDEIFGRAAREEDLSARRCDLLLVRINRNGLQITCVEVKSRKAAALPTQLAESIADQVEETRRLLINRFFAVDPPRVDDKLQRARLAGILHYYADRAVGSGTMPAHKVSDVHKLIDRHLEANSPVDIKVHGYVISLHGKAGFPDEHRQVPISVLTADDLGRAGFSTKFDELLRPDSDVDRESSDRTSIPVTPALNDSTPLPESLPELAGHETSGDERPSHVNPVLPSAGENGSSADAAVAVATEQASFATATAVQESPAKVDVVLGADGHGSDVTWSVSTKGSPHSFILGIPGQGKSVTTRRIVHSFSEAGLPSLLFDFHGDMADNPPAGAHVLDASKGLPFSPFEAVDSTGPFMNAVAFETAEIVAFVATLGEIQRSHVYKALQQSYAEALKSGSPAAPTVTQFAQALEAVEAAEKGKHARERVRPLTDFGLFSDASDGNFAPRHGGLVIDISSLTLDQVQLAATSFLLRKVYREMFLWPQDGTLKLAIVLDEAHRLAGDVTLPKLMKEGRKYGVVVVVASQGSSDFHKDVLGNAGTKIVFRTNFPESKQVAGFLRGRAGQDLSQEIEKLGVGQAYVSTPDSPQARRVFMQE